LAYRTSRKDLSVSERIAALQRGSSPQPQGNARHASPPGTPPTLPPSHSLKDKIAHFDALGTAPKPISSFGLGVTPVAEHRNVNRELYGNRIPGVNHKTGRSVSSGRELSQVASSSTSSLDHDHNPAHSKSSSVHSVDASEANAASSPTGSGQESLPATDGATATVPEIRRTDSMTENWVDTLQSKPAISVNTSGDPGMFAPPSPVPDSEDAIAHMGPATPLTSTLVRHLGISSHVPSRLGNETPMSVMVETGSLVDGEQPTLVPEDDNVPVPSSPVVSGMQALGLSDEHAEGDTTPTRDDVESTLALPTLAAAASLTPPTSAPLDESPNTPLARSVDVEGSVAPVSLSDNSQAGTIESGLKLSTGEETQRQGSELTTMNVHQLDVQSRLVPPPMTPSGPSSVIVEDGSVARSLQPSPAPQQQPEPSSALTPKQNLSDLPPLGQGSVPLSAATLQLLDLEGGRKGGPRRSGADTPMSILVETGSPDGKPRDLEGVDAPIATPAPASPTFSYFEEAKSDVVQPEQRADGSETKEDTFSVKVANSEPDNRT
jgi:hypothetical protein